MRRLAPLLLVPVLLLSACGTPDEAADVEQGIAEGEPDPNAGSAAGSCLVGDENCTDESFDGQDVTRPVPLSDEAPAGDPMPSGTSDLATAQRVVAVSLTGETTLTVGWEGTPCDVLVDGMVIEDDAEVRLFMLAGPESGTDMCAAMIQPWTTTIELSAPLGDRALLDISG